MISGYPTNENVCSNIIISVKVNNIITITIIKIAISVDSNTKSENYFNECGNIISPTVIDDDVILNHPSGYQNFNFHQLSTGFYPIRIHLPPIIYNTQDSKKIDILHDIRFKYLEYISKYLSKIIKVRSPNRVLGLIPRCTPIFNNTNELHCDDEIKNYRKCGSFNIPTNHIMPFKICYSSKCRDSGTSTPDDHAILKSDLTIYITYGLNNTQECQSSKYSDGYVVNSKIVFLFINRYMFI